MQIVGHRGAAGLAPGNTRASFQAAIKAGAQWIEFDVRATRDGHVVVVHDFHLLRHAGQTKLVKHQTLKHLQSLKIHGNHHMMSLAEAFNIIDGQAKIMIEIKSPGCARGVAQQIEAAVKKGAKYSDFMVISFYEQRLREVKWLNEEIPLCLLSLLHPMRFKKVHAIQLKAIGAPSHALTARVIEQAKLYGLKVYAFTVNSPRKAAKLRERGVDMIATNRPDILRSV
jgi:glycerophosphoryl diester phosphodiesterase